MKKVLIVEDEMIISLMMERLVRNMGHQVIGKPDTGEEAVDIALRERPDIILMDIRLKGELDGIDAMQRINEEHTIPVIFITGNSDQLSLSRLIDYDHVEFLTKPITSNELNRTLSRAS